MSDQIKPRAPILRISITGPGVVSVRADDVVNSPNGRRVLDALSRLDKNGKPLPIRNGRWRA